MPCSLRLNKRANAKRSCAYYTMIQVHTTFAAFLFPKRRSRRGGCAGILDPDMPLSSNFVEFEDSIQNIA